MKDRVPRKNGLASLVHGCGLAAAIFLGATALFAAPAAAQVNSGTPIAVAPGVPDQGRAWELITSPDPTGASVYNMRAIAVDGDRISYMSRGPLPGAESGAPLFSANVAERGVGGWINHQVLTPYAEQGAYPGNGNTVYYYGPEIFDPNLTRWWGVRNTVGGPADPPNEVHLFSWPLQGAFTDLAVLGRMGNIAGASTDVQRVFVTSEGHLLPADASRTEGTSIYEARGGSLRIVDVDDSGSLISTCGATAPERRNPGAFGFKPYSSAVSTDGDRIYFSARPGCSGTQRVFLREGAATTTEVSASQCTRPDCGPQADVTYVGGTPDGAHAFLVSAQQLTDADTNSHADLYRYDVAGQELTLLSSGPGAPEIAPTTEIAECSADGSRVYFHAMEWDGTEAVGRDEVYLASAGAVRLVPEVGVEILYTSTWESHFLPIPDDGRFAVYATRAPLVPADTDNSIDIYKFDAATGAVSRISAGPAGGNAAVDASILPGFFADTVFSHPYRPVTSDGSRIFFTTAEQLVAADRNDVADVYEWVDGTLGLVSAGSGKWPSRFIGTTPDGRTVIIETTGTLLPLDRDGGQNDFYAARIGGGFPEPPEPPAECMGSACRAGSPKRTIGPTSPTALESSGGGLVLRASSSEALRRAAATGRLTVLIEVPSPGRLAARAWARFGGRKNPIASKAVEVQVSGPVELELKLSRDARRQLGRGRDLYVRLTVRLDSRSLDRTTRLTLKGKGR